MKLPRIPLRRQKLPKVVGKDIGPGSLGDHLPMQEIRGLECCCGWAGEGREEGLLIPASPGRKPGVLGLQAGVRACVGGLGHVAVRGSDCIWSVWTSWWAGPLRSVGVQCKSLWVAAGERGLENGDGGRWDPATRSAPHPPGSPAVLWVISGRWAGWDGTQMGRRCFSLSALIHTRSVDSPSLPLVSEDEGRGDSSSGR